MDESCICVALGTISDLGTVKLLWLISAKSADACAAPLVNAVLSFVLLAVVTVKGETTLSQHCIHSARQKARNDHRDKGTGTEAKGPELQWQKAARTRLSNDSFKTTGIGESLDKGR